MTKQLTPKQLDARVRKCEASVKLQAQYRGESDARARADGRLAAEVAFQRLKGEASR